MINLIKEKLKKLIPVYPDSLTTLDERQRLADQVSLYGFSDDELQVIDKFLDLPSDRMMYLTSYFDWVSSLHQDAPNRPPIETNKTDWFAEIAKYTKKRLLAKKVSPDYIQSYEVDIIYGNLISYSFGLQAEYEARQQFGDKLGLIEDWLKVHALARALVENKSATISQRAIMKAEMERLFAELDVNVKRGQKGGRRKTGGLQDAINDIVKEIHSETGKCSFGDLTTWLQTNARGIDTGYNDCDELEYLPEDTHQELKPRIAWIDSTGKQECKAVSSLKNTYFKEAKKMLG